MLFNQNKILEYFTSQIFFNKSRQNPVQFVFYKFVIFMAVKTLKMGNLIFFFK